MELVVNKVLLQFQPEDKPGLKCWMLNIGY